MSLSSGSLFLLIYLPILMSVPHCFDYCSFLMCIEARKCEASIFHLHSQDSFACWEGSFVVTYEFEDFFFLYRSYIGIFIGVALNV